MSFDYQAAIRAKPLPSPDDALDPKFYVRSQNTTCWPPQPLAVVGYAFDPTTGTFDFSKVPDFDFARLASIQHLQTGRILYGRPADPWCGLAEVDGVPIPRFPRTGKVIRTIVDTRDLCADDEIVCSYDRATT